MKGSVYERLKMVRFGLQVEQKASCDDYLSLIYLSIDAVTEGLLLSALFGHSAMNEGILDFVSGHFTVSNTHYLYRPFPK